MIFLYVRERERERLRERDFDRYTCIKSRLFNRCSLHMVTLPFYTHFGEITNSLLKLKVHLNMHILGIFVSIRILKHHHFFDMCGSRKNLQGVRMIITKFYDCQEPILV